MQKRVQGNPLKESVVSSLVEIADIILDNSSAFKFLLSWKKLHDSRMLMAKFPKKHAQSPQTKYH